MCGRYVSPDIRALEREYELAFPFFEQSFNVAPTDPVPVVRIENGKRVGALLRWGLIPFAARGIAPKYSTINARSEALDTSGVWKGPWTRGQRCIQPAVGFYEWHVDQAGRKHPYYIHLADHEIFGLAGLWDRSFTADQKAIESCTIITVSANDLLREIHNAGANPNRMPAILSPADYANWLTGDAKAAKALLRPYPQDVMTGYRVGNAVNSPKNDAPSLIEPIS